MSNITSYKTQSKSICKSSIKLFQDLQPKKTITKSHFQSKPMFDWIITKTKINVKHNIEKIKNKFSFTKNYHINQQNNNHIFIIKHFFKKNK